MAGQTSCSSPYLCLTQASQTLRHSIKRCSRGWRLRGLARGAVTMAGETPMMIVRGLIALGHITGIFVCLLASPHRSSFDSRRDSPPP